MRIIAGLYKGRRLASAKGDWLRPTSDRNREFIFSYLGNLVDGAQVLDLFAGTGSLGIEALSRGASTAMFVDAAFQATLITKKNIEMLGVQAIVHKQDVKAFLKRTLNKVDIIFADPPYGFAEFAEILQIISTRGLLMERGLVVYEYSSRSAAPVVSDYRQTKTKALGDTCVTIYELL
jgi:16S rRNA (guanine966-N2)-methyltransferase